jgi:ATP-dependent Clp protease ATP-binding subunit ClpA
LRRAIQRLLEDALAEQVLQGKFKEGDTIETGLDGEAIVFQKAAKKAAKAEKADKGEKGEKGEKSEDKPVEEPAASAGKS